MMGNATKLTLSAKEQSMVNDTEWILTKQLIIQKASSLFAACIPAIKEKVLTPYIALPPEVVSSVPKISKGENYQQLPYVMLDYPRCFSGADIFAIRTMFWWGNFFSITLHLSGKYKTGLQQQLTTHAGMLSDDFYMGINDDQWAHHFMESNYLPVNSIPEADQNTILAQKPFLKLALKYKLDDWNIMKELLQEGYEKIARILA